MICKECNITMKRGTTYEKSNKKGILTRKFYVCPKCHFKKYDSKSNFLVEFAKNTE